MTEFNGPLLRKAVAWAEAEAARPVAESEWCQTFFAIKGEKIGRTCGTAYCIAGWVLAEYDQGDHEITAYSIDGSGGAEDAEDLLGITDQDAWGNLYSDGLFTASNTIEEVRWFAERIARKYGEEL